MTRLAMEEGEDGSKRMKELRNVAWNEQDRENEREKEREGDHPEEKEEENGKAVSFSRFALGKPTKKRMFLRAERATKEKESKNEGRWFASKAQTSSSLFARSSFSSFLEFLVFG